MSHLQSALLFVVLSAELERCSSLRSCKLWSIRLTTHVVLPHNLLNLLTFMPPLNAHYKNFLLSKISPPSKIVRYLFVVGISIPSAIIVAIVSLASCIKHYRMHPLHVIHNMAARSDSMMIWNVLKFNDLIAGNYNSKWWYLHYASNTCATRLRSPFNNYGSSKFAGCRKCTRQH